jgi:hypothetical protein
MGDRYRELLAALEAPDTAVIEEAVGEMLRSGDRRFVEPLVRLLGAEDVEGAHIADHVVWVVYEHEETSPIAMEVLRLDAERA